MNNILNNTGLWLSIGASFVAIIAGVASLVRFLLRQHAQRSGQMTLLDNGRVAYWPQSKGIGYHFGCLLKTVIIIVLIIALATVLTYITMGILAVYIESHQPVPYISP